MSGPLILAGTERWVAVVNGKVATHKGRLIVATTEKERAEFVGTVVPLPPEWISVTDWLAEQGVDINKMPAAPSDKADDYPTAAELLEMAAEAFAGAEGQVA